MEMIILKQENKDVFQNFFSAETFAQIGEANVIAVGAVDLYSEEESELTGTAVGGALILLESSQKCKLDWIFVEKNYRRKKAATFMMQEIFGILQNAGYREMEFITQNSDSENGIHDFLVSLRAEFMTDQINIPTMKAINVLNALRVYYDPSRVISTTQLTNGDYYEKVKQMAKGNPLHDVMPMFWQLTSELRSNSFVIKNEEGADSVVLCLPNETENGTLIFDIHAFRKMDILTLLAQVALKAMELYGQDAMLTMITCTGAEEDLPQYIGGAESMLGLRMGRIRFSI